MVRQVPTVGVLLIVQGSMEVIASLFCLIYGVMYGALALLPLTSDAFPRNQNPEAPSPEALSAFFGGAGVFFIVAAIVVLALGVLKIVAGGYNHRYRKRLLGIAALASCAMSLITCYCAPTAVALAIYGLIVYLNATVERAFAMGDAGHSPNAILRALLPPG